MVRLSLFALLFLALVATCTAAGVFPPLANNGSMTLLSYKVSRAQQTCGSKLTLTSKVRLTSFGDATTLYCAFKNLGFPGTNVTLKERVTRFTHMNTRKFGINAGYDDGPGAGKFWWLWKRDSAAYSENKDYSLKVITILDKDTTASSYTWQFYCETKKENFTSHYFWPKASTDTTVRIRCPNPKV